MPFWSDGSVPTGLANQAGQYIEFFHLVSRTSVAFRAFVTSYEDKWASEWNTEEAFGRMDPIATFKRTGRKISLGWEVVAEDHLSAYTNLADVSKLVRMLYPSYDSGPAGVNGPARPSTTHIAGPPLLKLKFMNLIRDAKGGAGSGAGAAESGLLGYVDGFTHSPVLEEGFIEDTSEGNSLLPKAIKLSCTFTVLHTHSLGWDQYGVWRSESDYPYRNVMTAQQQEAVENRVIVQEAEAEEAAQNAREEAIAAGEEVVEEEEGGFFTGLFGGD